MTNRTFPESGEVRVQDRPLPEGDVDEVLIETTASLAGHRVPFESAPETYRELLVDRTDAMGVVVD